MGAAEARMDPEREQSRQITLAGGCEHLKTRRLHLLDGILPIGYTPEQWEPSECSRACCSFFDRTSERWQFEICDDETRSTELFPGVNRDRWGSPRPNYEFLAASRLKSIRRRTHSALLERAYSQMLKYFKFADGPRPTLHGCSLSLTDYVLIGKNRRPSKKLCFV